MLAASAALRRSRTVDFTNTVIVMTSNLGAGQAKRSLGFTGGGAEPAADRMLDAAKRAFLPEFLNRIDEIVVFASLTEEQVQRIGELLCSRIAERLRQERGVELEVDPALVARLAREGFDAEFGARPLKRHLRRTLEKELTRAILDGRIEAGARVRAVDVEAHTDSDGNGDGDQGIMLEVLEPAQV